MAENLPRLRPELDLISSPSAASPGLILRDPFHYTEEILLVVPAWVPALAFLDGRHTEADLQAYLTRMAGGDLAFREPIRRFIQTLSGGGFLENEEFHRRRGAKHRAFREAARREAAHAGTGYPADPGELDRHLREHFGIPPAPGPSENDGLLGVAAPHVSPSGGVESYRAAYRRLAPALEERTFVILGTSHYGEPEKFGVTRKPYATPLGVAEVDSGLLERLVREAPGALVAEDYCHAIEHSIEFQVVFLQQLFGGKLRILPILCGPLADSLRSGRPPESNPGVRRFIDALSGLASAEGRRLFWVLGVDLAHMGARYGDGWTATAGEGRMIEISARDRARLDRVSAGDPEGLFELVQAGQDDLKWCGYPPLYVFLRAVGQVFPRLAGDLLRYEQWNIDPQSVVSFAALEFFETDGLGRSPR